jgi:hypothetical protein
MVEVTLTSEDGSEQARLMFGAEFSHHIRRGQPGRIAVSDGIGTTIIEFDEIVCDVCNASIGPYDPMILTHWGAYCWSCTGEYITPKIKGK